MHVCMSAGKKIGTVFISRLLRIPLSRLTTNSIRFPRCDVRADAR